MKIKVFTAFVMMLAIFSACEKDDSGPDLATAVTGTYAGTITVVGTGSAAGTCVISKSSDTKVNMKITISTTTATLPGISVSSAGTDSWDLSLTDSSGTFEGSVNGNTLTWTMTGGGYVETFSGTRQ